MVENRGLAMSRVEVPQRVKVPQRVVGVQPQGWKKTHPRVEY